MFLSFLTRPIFVRSSEGTRERRGDLDHHSTMS